MTNELTVNISSNLTNGNHKESFGSGTFRVDQDAIGAHSPVVIVGTSEEVMAVGDVSTLGWLFLQNLDDTNYVTYGPDDGGGSMVAFGRIEPGELHAFRLEPGITMRWQADTADVKVKMLLLED